MTDGVPSFPYHPYSITDDNGMVNTEPTKKGVATVENTRRLAKDLTKVMKLKPRLKAPKRRKLDVKWY